MVFGWFAETRRTAAAVAEFPEEVGWMRVCVAGGGCSDPRIDADEDTDQIGCERVRQEVGEMGVFGGRCVS